MSRDVPAVVDFAAPRFHGSSTLKQVLRVWRRHILLFMVVAATVFGAGILAMLVLKPSYTATAVVAISQPGTDPLAPSQQAQPGGSDDDLPQTVADEIESRDVAAAVLAQLPPVSPDSGLSFPELAEREFCTEGLNIFCAKPAKLDADQARQVAIDEFLNTVTVLPELRSQVIDVSVTAPTGQRAAAVADALVSNYQRLALAEQTDDLNRVAAWLDERTAQLRARWLDAVSAANDFSVANGLTNASQGVSPSPLVDTQITNMAASLGVAQASLAAARARADALHDASGRGDRAALLSLPDQPILVAAAGQLMQLESERRQLAAEFGPDYPKIQALDQEIAATRATMGAQTGSALSSITESLVTAKAQVDELTGNLNGLKAQAAAQSAAEAKYQSLNDEATSAQTVYETFLEHENEIVDRAALLEPPVEVVSHAGVPLSPTLPNKTKLGLGLVVISLAAGAAAAAARDYISDGFAEADDLRASVQHPLLATLPVLSGQPPDAIARHILDAPFSRTSEGVRGLASKLSLLSADAKTPRAILVTSASAIEGKSTLALWLAMAMRQGGHAVLVIDGDHRRSSVLRHAASPQSAGLTDYLTNTASPSQLIQKDPATGIDFIASGKAMSRPFGPFEIDRLRSLITTMKQQYGMIVIDSPPLLAMTDGFVHGSIADQTIFVCRWQRTSKQAVMASLNRLEEFDAKVAGVVVTMVDENATAAFEGDYSRREMKLISGLYGT